MKKALSLFLAISLLFSMINISVSAERDDDIQERISCINIEKEVNNTDVKAGDTIIYTIQIRNIGQTKLTAIKVTDSFSGDTERISVPYLPAGVAYTGNGIFQIDELDIYDGITIAYSYNTDDSDVGTLMNAVVVEAIPEGGWEDDKVSDDAEADPVNVSEKPVPKLSAVSIEKNVDKTNVEVDDTLVFTLNIKNIGETKLTDVKVSDIFGGNSAEIQIDVLPTNVSYIGNGIFEISELERNECTIISYSYIATETDVGILTNTAIVEAIPEGGREQDKVSDEASSAVTVAEKPVPKVSAVSIEKKVDKTSVEVGDTLIFIIDIKNTGETKLSDVNVVDTFSGDIVQVQVNTLPTGVIYAGNGVFSLSELAPNESVSISYSYVTTDNDVGTLTNAATVEAIPEDGDEEDEVTDDASSSEVTVTEKPATKVSDISIEKSVDKERVNVGNKLLFTLDIRNIGETILTAVKIVDDFSGNIDRIEIHELPKGSRYSGNGLFELDTLDVNEGITIAYSYITRKQDIGTLFNTAIVEGIPAGGTEHDKVFDDDTASSNIFEDVIRPLKPQLVQKGDHLSYIIGYPDGNVRPLGTITRAEVATIFFRLLTDESRDDYWSQKNSFSDVNAEDWFNNAVSTMASAGIVNGYPDGSFRPQAPVSRAEFAAIATRFTEAGCDGVSKQYFKQYFKDINQDDWYAAAVELAYELGWAQGFAGDYRPEDLMTRAEVMTMINRILERETSVDDMLPEMVAWPDNQPDAWYYEAVQEATNSHVYKRTSKKVPKLSFNYESWQKIIENPDWLALEHEWSAANSQN